MAQKKEMSARALEMKELEMVNGGIGPWKLPGYGKPINEQK